LGLLNISLPWQIHAQEETAIISWRECSKKSDQQGRSHFDVRSVHGVREHGKMARTPLAAFFNIPILATCFQGKTASKPPQQMHDLIIKNPPDRETLGQFSLDLYDPGMEVFGRVNP
jgi:hypothetical protein